MGPYPPRDVLALRAPSNQRSANEVGVSTPCGSVPTRDSSVSASVSSELYRYKSVSEPGVELYSPRVRRNWGFAPRGNSSLAPGDSSLTGSANGIWARKTRENIAYFVVRYKSRSKDCSSGHTYTLSRSQILGYVYRS